MFFSTSFPLPNLFFVLFFCALNIYHVRLMDGFKFDGIFDHLIVFMLLCCVFDSFFSPCLLNVYQLSCIGV